MKALAINGSHRKGKNTAALLKLVLQELERGGVDTELLEVSDLRIDFCRSCNRCLRKTECSIRDDDMPMVGQKMLAADAIIIGSPVYFSNVTSRLKLFMDRTRWMHMAENLLDGKLGAALTCAGLRNGGQEITQLILERFLQGHGLRVVEARDPRAGVFNLGPMATLFEAFDGSAIHWKTGALQDALAVHTCRALGRNLLRHMQPGHTGATAADA
jgi:multimeric flavodoxin WrbA